MPVELLRPVGYLRVRLVTVNGALVTDLAIPPFDKSPEVILWGARAFLKTSGPGMGIYREATSYAVPYKDEDV